MTIVIAVFIAALLFALVGTPAAKKLAFRLGLISMPRTDRAHQEPTAMLGGVAIYGGALAALFVGTGVAALVLDGWKNVDELAAILAGATVMGAVGLYDDRVELRPFPKLLAQFVAVGLPVLFGVQIQLDIPKVVNIGLYGEVLIISNKEVKVFFG